MAIMSRATAKARTEEIVNLQARLGALMKDALDREIWLGVGLRSWEDWLIRVETDVAAAGIPAPPPRLAPPVQRTSQVDPIWKTGGKKKADDR